LKIVALQVCLELHTGTDVADLQEGFKRQQMGLKLPINGIQKRIK
jgi:hypothetical protein